MYIELYVGWERMWMLSKCCHNGCGGLVNLPARNVFASSKWLYSSGTTGCGGGIHGKSIRRSVTLVAAGSRQQIKGIRLQRRSGLHHSGGRALHTSLFRASHTPSKTTPSAASSIRTKSTYLMTNRKTAAGMSKRQFTGLNVWLTRI